MRLRHIARIALGGTLAAGLTMSTAPLAQERGPLAFDPAKVTIDGTSNVHAYSASTTAVRLTRVQLGSGVTGPNFWEEIVKPGGLAAFEIAIPAATLSSPKKDLDKNMHKALKTQEHSDITFKLVRLEPAGAGLRAFGLLKITGVEREVALDITTERRDAGLAVRGEVTLLMTDFGIAPPKAMLGMLRTDPKVKVSFETVLSVAHTE
jgi:hypothetical protein